MNDLRIALEALKAVIRSRPGLEIAWTAEDGREAVERAKSDRPDLILMDMVMPEMDGVEATRRIMRESPCPILVVTATIEGNAARVYDALGSGAVDAVTTPVLGTGGRIDGAADLLRKIEHVRLLHCAGAERPSTIPPIAAGAGGAARAASAAPASRAVRKILAIGASTGGPQAVATVLERLPKPCPWPILLVQHLGDEFVAGLAEWLARRSGLACSLVERSQPLRSGTVHIAARPGHLVVEERGRAEVVVDLYQEPRDDLHRPSVDVLFASLARGATLGVAVLLTGMGRDGAAGLFALRQRGWWTIAQDRATSVVWGMPGEAVRIGAACATLPLESIGPAIVAAFTGSASIEPRPESTR